MDVTPLLIVTAVLSTSTIFMVMLLVWLTINVHKNPDDRLVIIAGIIITCIAIPVAVLLWIEQISFMPLHNCLITPDPFIQLCFK